MHGVAYGVQVGASARLGHEPTKETAPTLRAEHHSGDNQASVIAPTHTHTHTAFAESGFSKWEEGEQSIPIRASGGCIGGGSETLIAEDRGNTVC